MYDNHTRSSLCLVTAHMVKLPLVGGPNFQIFGFHPMFEPLPHLNYVLDADEHSFPEAPMGTHLKSNIIFCQ